MGDISDVKMHNEISIIEKIIKTENRFLIAATGRRRERLLLNGVLILQKQKSRRG